MLDIIYFSNVSNNTHRFIEKLEPESVVRRIPIKGIFEEELHRPYVLITPTYNERGVPIQVMKFLNKHQHRNQLAGVIASGNINFGEDYAKAGLVISKKCNVPLLYTFELTGTPKDIIKVKEGLKKYVS
ncbi:MAG: class Ib ribonucleoside-diphosphate reductase assembly flavoprotein NrdI [Enterococcus sp.]|nr:class Ib ribonucleoside-diphosphate reductase assembly flavoprotein NrdI [Enterococcus sp.]